MSNVRKWINIITKLHLMEIPYLLDNLPNRVQSHNSGRFLASRILWLRFLNKKKKINITRSAERGGPDVVKINSVKKKNINTY